MALTTPIGNFVKSDVCLNPEHYAVYERDGTFTGYYYVRANPKPLFFDHQLGRDSGFTHSYLLVRNEPDQHSSRSECIVKGVI